MKVTNVCLFTLFNRPGNISEEFRVIRWRQNLQNITGLMKYQNSRKQTTNPTERSLKRVSWNKQLSFFTNETTQCVPEIYFILRYRIDCKEHNRENKLLKITKCDEEWGSVSKATNKATGSKPAAYDNENASRVKYVELLGFVKTWLQGALHGSILPLMLNCETTKKYRPEKLHNQETTTTQHQIFGMSIWWLAEF
jgi:hypothetical protein